VASRKSAQEIMTTAYDWLVRCDRGLSTQEQAEFDCWMTADTRHLGAIARAQAQWTHASRLQIVGAQPLPKPAPPPAKRWIRSAWTAAAIFIAAVSVTLFTVQRYVGTHFDTTVGEVRRIPLSDGSSVTLDTNSKMALAYTSQARIVRLLVGEAFFEVAHDPSKPFIVEAGAVRVRAVGTAFIVRCELESKVQVTVTRGVVDVWRQGKIVEPAVRVAANGRVVATPAAVEPIVGVSEAEVARSIAWQDGIIDLQGRTLSQAAAEFNRYNEQTLIIEDPVLAKQPVVGRFHTNDPLGFAHAAAEVLDARVHVRNEQIVLER